MCAVRPPPVSLTPASHCHTFREAFPHELFEHGPYLITAHCFDIYDHGPTECSFIRYTAVKEPAPPPVQAPAHLRAYTALRAAALAFPANARVFPARTRALGCTAWREAVGVCKELHADARNDMEVMAMILVDTVQTVLFLLFVRH
jgi:hypothetical protein